MIAFSKFWQICALTVFLFAGVSLAAGPAGAARKGNNLTGETAYKQGLKLLKKRQHKKAIEKFTYALTSDTLGDRTFAMAHYHRGVTYQSSGQSEKARKDYTLAIKQDVLSSEMLKTIYYNRGLVHDTLKRPNAAFADFTSALEIDPKFAAGYHNLGNVLRKMGRHKRAVAHLIKSLKLGNPQPHLPYMSLALAYEALGRNKDAITSAKYALKLKPKLRRAQAILARLTTNDLYSFPAQKRALKTEVATTSTPTPTAITRSPVTTAAIDVKQSKSRLPSKSNLVLSEFERLDLKMAGQTNDQPKPVRYGKLALRGKFGTSSLGSVAVVVPGPGLKKVTEPVKVIRVLPLPKPNLRRLARQKRGLKGMYLAQLGAGNSQDNAEKMWFLLKIQHKDLLKPLKSNIERVDLGAQGVFYRVQAGPFKSQDSAEILCTKIKKRGVNCFSVKARS